MQWFHDIRATFDETLTALRLKGETLFEYALSFGITPDEMVVILIGAGIAFLVLLFLMSRLVRKSGATRRPRSPRHEIPPVDRPGDEDNQRKLSEIEREMIALRELYDAGRIDASVYLDETRDLYNKAKSLS